MRFFVVGLGSMGKRRIRCLKKIGHNDIIAFDMREDRRKEAGDKYGIKTVSAIDKLDFSGVETIIISTPPDRHSEYIKLAIEKKKPAFVEASVVLEGLEALNKRAKKEGVFIAPSCTFRFHAAIRKIKDIVNNAKYGKVTNFSYFSGQYLPDWHPWEDVKDFYVSKKETGGAREIMPFELTWIVDIFGFPKNIKGFFGKTMDVGADIDDTYAVSLDFGNMFGNMTIDVVSRFATRFLILNMEHAQILWKWDENALRIYDAFGKNWTQHEYAKGEAVRGYNKNIAEDMYIDELKAFIDASAGKDRFPNSLDDDIKVLKLLKKIERTPQ